MDQGADTTDITLGGFARGKPWRGSGRPFWWHAAPPAQGPWDAPPPAADVVVIGSGFTGLSAALVLARAGRHVVIVDAGVPGFGASTRAGGQVGSGNQKFRVKTLIAMKGERHAVALLREGVEMLDGIESLIQDEKIDCDFRRCGRFRGAMHPDHYEAMARDMEDLRRYAGVDSAMVPRAEQHREVGTDLFHGGSVLPMDAGLHPGKYHAGLLARAVEAGVQVLGNMPVRGIRSEANHHGVCCDQHVIRARNVLVATNGYTKNVGAYFRKRIFPVLSAQIATGQIPPHIFATLLPSNRVYGNTNRVFFYFRPAPGEPRLIWGGRGDWLSRERGAGIHAHLARNLLQTFPMLADIPVSHAWSGRIGYTFDEFPHLGCSPAGVHYAMGYCGTGISRATHFGRKIAWQMLGDPRGESAFSALAFPSHRFHAFTKIGVPAVTAWYRLRDRFHI